MTRPTEPLLERLARSAWALPILMAVLAAIHLQGLGGPPLAGTEGHRVIPAREMLASGEFTVPTLFGRTYTMKPPLYPWVLAGVEATVGGNTWTWRLPSVAFHALALAACFLFARRWFGPVAASLAGVAFVLLVGLWQEARTADIDPLDTLASAVAALALLELMLGAGARKPWPWVALAGASLAAAIFCKVVGVLPVLVGVLVGAPLASGNVRAVLNLRVLTSLALATVPTLAWRLLALHRIHAAGLPTDSDGAQEGLSRLYPHSLGQLAHAAANPAILLAYALPASAMLLWAFHPAIRSRRRDPGPERLIFALATSVLAGLGALLLSGTVNERYAYVVFPLFPVLAAGVLTRLHREPHGLDLARWTAIGSSVAMAVLPIVLLVIVPRSAVPRAPAPPLAWIGGAIAIATALIAVLSASRGLLVRAAALLLISAIASGSPFAEYCNRRRDAHSGLRAARKLAPLLPPAATVTVGSMSRFQPEMLLYLNHPIRNLWRDIAKPENLPDHGWLIVDDPELRALQSANAGTLTVKLRFESNGLTYQLAEFDRTPR